MIKYLEDTKDFSTTIAENDVVLVDFYADWCGPCLMAAPVLEELSEYYTNRIMILKVDTEAFPELSAQYGIQSIPSFFIFKKKEFKEKFMGFHSFDTFQEKLDKLV